MPATFPIYDKDGNYVTQARWDEAEKLLGAQIAQPEPSPKEKAEARRKELCEQLWSVQNQLSLLNGQLQQMQVERGSLINRSEHLQSLIRNVNVEIGAL